MAKISFNEKWSVLRGVKATHVDFAGAPPGAKSGQTASTTGKRERASRGGAAVEAKNRSGQGTQELEGRRCIRPDGGVNPQCKEYKANLEGREKLKEGSDMGTIKENFNLLKSGKAGYSSAYLQNGRHGEVYTDAQAWAIAYKKAGLSGEGTGKARASKSKRDTFYDRHLPSVHRSRFEDHDKAHGVLRDSWKQHDAEVKQLTKTLEDYLAKNPGASPEQMVADLNLKKIARNLDEDDVTGIVNEVTGQGGQSGPGAMPKMPQMSPQQKEQFIDGFNAKYNADLDDVIDKIAQQVGILDATPDQYTPEQYNQLIAELKKQFPDLSQEELMKAAQASNYEPSTQQAQAATNKASGKPGLIAKKLKAALSPFTNRGTSSRGTSKADREAAASRFKAAGDNRAKAEGATDEDISNIDRALAAKKAPPPQRPGRLPRETAPQNPDTQERMGKAFDQRKNEREQAINQVLRDLKNEGKQERAASAGGGGKEPPSGSGSPEVTKDSLLEMLNSHSGDNEALAAKLMALLGKGGDAPTSPTETPTPATRQTSRTAASANNSTAATTSSTSGNTGRRRRQSGASANNNPRRGVTKGKGGKGKIDASEHSIIRPYGWNYAEECSDPNVVKGEDVNDSSIKLPSGWAPKN